MVVRLLGLLEASLEPGRVEVGGVGRDLRAEEIERHRAVEVQVLLHRRQVDAAVTADVVGAVLAHQLAGLLHDTPDARLTHEHVVRLLGQHEAARARERIEAALGQAGELVLAVTVGEEAEHEERQPVGRLLVEGPEDAGLVGVARAALQEPLGLLAAVAAEVRVQEVHHRPQVPAFLHVDLEDVAQIVERGTRAPEVPLLLDRGRLGIALGDDQPPQRAPILSGHLLPGRRALVLAERDAASGLRLGQEDAPAILRHLHPVEVRPALRVDADGRAEVDVLGLEPVGAHLLPPVEIARLPFLERAEQAAVLGEADIVRDALGIVDARHHTLLGSNSARCPVP